MMSLSGKLNRRNLSGRRVPGVKWQHRKCATVDDYDACILQLAPRILLKGEEGEKGRAQTPPFLYLEPYSGKPHMHMFASIEWVKQATEVTLQAFQGLPRVAGTVTWRTPGGCTVTVGEGAKPSAWAGARSNGRSQVQVADDTRR